MGSLGLTGKSTCMTDQLAPASLVEAMSRVGSGSPASRAAPTRWTCSERKREYLFLLDGVRAELRWPNDYRCRLSSKVDPNSSIQHQERALRTRWTSLCDRVVGQYGCQCHGKAEKISREQTGGENSWARCRMSPPPYPGVHENGDSSWGRKGDLPTEKCVAHVSTGISFLISKIWHDCTPHFPSALHSLDGRLLPTLRPSLSLRFCPDAYFARSSLSEHRAGK